MKQIYTQIFSSLHEMKSRVSLAKTETKRKWKEMEKNESDANGMLNVESQNRKKRAELLTEFF